MPEKNWKRTEREFAKYFGGKRVPITGRNRGSAPDIAHEHLAIEVKYRQNLPAWILDALDQANASKVTDKQLPVVLFRKERQKLKTCAVMLTASDFKMLLRKAGMIPEEDE